MLRQSPYFKSNKQKFFEPDSLRAQPSTLAVSTGVQLHSHLEQPLRDRCYCCQSNANQLSKCGECSRLACSKCLQTCEMCSRLICKFDARTDYSSDRLLCWSCNS